MLLFVLGHWNAAHAEGTSEKIEISLESGSPSERSAETQLRRILAAHDLDHLIITRRVHIDQGAIPHSHPVLTLNSRHLDDDQLQLATFIHEQLHWHTSRQWETVRAAIDDLRKIYPVVPVGGPQGGRDEVSTYLHLIVNLMEFDALAQFLNRETARDIIERKDFYLWIYGKVLSDEARLREVMTKHRLGLPLQ